MLIGLREGLEGGLVVSILLAAVRRSDSRASTGPVWLGVLAAVILSLSFGAVLTFSKSGLSTTAQEAFGGILSVIAVGLVSVMIFWMRRTARSLSGELREKVGNALRLGGGALALTAFLAVAREGLETALFLWTTVQASGESTAPLIGAAVGIAIAVLLCFLLFRSAIRINLGVFFSRTAIFLIVIAAGVLAYGLGELQSSGLLPGHSWRAFDLTGSIPADTWWATIITGVTNLTPAMTWLQVVGYLGYVGVMLTMFLRANAKPAAQPAKAVPAEAASAERAPAEPAAAEAVASDAAAPDAVVEPAVRGDRKRWLVVTAAIGVPLLAAGLFAVLTRSPATGTAAQVTITASACAPEFTAPPAGAQTFTIVNKSGRSGEIYLIHPADGGVVGEIEGIGPGTQRSMSVSLPAGEYAWRCAMIGDQERMSATVRASGGVDRTAVPAVLPLAEKELDGPVAAYRDYVTPKLGELAGQVDALRAALAGGDQAAARAAWLPAQLTWERVGAAYGSFGDLSDAIDGGPAGLADGVRDKDFGGLRRIEYGLWHGEDVAALAPVADKLAADVADLRQKLPTVTADPKDLPLRGHEILEDALRDHLSGLSNQGADTGYQETLADLDGTRVVLDELAPLLTARRPDLMPAATAKMATLEQALKATKAPLGQLPLAERQRVNAAVGDLLETLSLVPDLLEIRQK
ncbi:iron permease [Solihabitans fulvus]|uniref:Iron permease n=1 Tax=Solihabitans fulvus TaxID=1892852 RepID=A0A5B2XEF7_9PSEU|nr:iron permease [Solihabitans fulvus]